MSKPYLNLRDGLEKIVYYTVVANHPLLHMYLLDLQAHQT